MKKLEKLTTHAKIDISKVWGGTQAEQCYTLASNQNLTNAGYCDTVFKLD